jgi:hypothetical protein
MRSSLPSQGCSNSQGASTGPPQMYSSSLAQRSRSSRNFGWAMPICLRVRYLMVLPHSSATPYSVTTQSTMFLNVVTAGMKLRHDAGDRLVRGCRVQHDKGLAMLGEDRPTREVRLATRRRPVLTAQRFGSALAEEVDFEGGVDDGGNHARRRSLHARCRWRWYESSISAYRWQTRTALAAMAAHDLILPEEHLFEAGFPPPVSHDHTPFRRRLNMVFETPNRDATVQTLMPGMRKAPGLSQQIGQRAEGRLGNRAPSRTRTSPLPGEQSAKARSSSSSERCPKRSCRKVRSGKAALLSSSTVGLQCSTALSRPRSR